VTVPLGGAIAIPAIRFSGIYLALVTLGFGILLQYVLYPTFLMFGTDLSVQASRPHFGPIAADTSDTWQYYVALSVAAGGIALLVAVNRSRFGRLLRGLAESPTMLNTLGLDVNVTRLMLFCIAAFIAGVAGALTASQFAVSATSFQPIQSLVIVALLGICAIFGTRLILTTILAALMLSVLPGYTRSFDTNYQLLFFGLGAIAVGLLIANRAAVLAAVERRAGGGADRRRHSPVADRAPFPKPHRRMSLPVREPVATDA
jgi:ABC-type branched-subunit amino acid transport system permease subunit